ncbi:hypothetical protein [Aminipila luticellarii]|uniref:EamA-like transporter family protein n=1 Tax=Aminipila luticellarii TaxID=2507160 RepID=A0A410PTX9_9FIRM|nr:hypothetical protein [Aminipila luticellarii]QAT42360.1 hypothetical protein EQM06_03435 [Aminipila luticellarii]
MNEVSGAVSAQAVTAKKKLASSFFKKGITIAILSGILYGFYTAFLTLGMTKGVWSDWYGANTAGLSVFIITFAIASIGSSLNDTLSGVWALAYAAFRGKAGDFFRVLRTKPGKIMIGVALIGGPISSTAYVIGLQMAGSIVVPISALCPCIGAIISRFLYKQALGARRLIGILICVAASGIIGAQGMALDAPDGMLLGICIAFIAAVGWGIEGCVGGYNCCMMDSEIGITIRQLTSGLSNLIVLVPIFGMLSGEGPGKTLSLAAQAFSDSNSILFFVISGGFAFASYMFWYRGNSMCGTALGMACNGAFSFWGPFCCWLVLGLAWGIEGWNLAPAAWFAAVLMIIGIFIIAVNPSELFGKKEEN